MKKIVLILFVFAALAELLSEFIDMPMLHFVAKPLIMISLGIYYFSASAPANRSTTVILAIVFSLAGDVLLMNPDYFIGGLVAFLLAHVLYIFSYRQHRSHETGEALAGIQRLRLAFPVVLAGTGLVVVLYPVLGDLKIPVMVYAAVLMLMVLQALFRFGKTNSDSFWMVFAGAALFMVSDSVLAINKFLQPVPYGGSWIMITYISAQYLIIRGLLRHSFLRDGL